MSVGSTLRARREELDLTLPSLAAYLNIRPVYIAAIENDDFDALPAGAYAVGFVKTYARALGLEENKVAADFRREQAGAARQPALIMRAPVSESRAPTLGLIALGLALLAAAWLGWAYFHPSNRALAEAVPAVPARLDPQTQTVDNHGPAEQQAADPAAPQAVSSALSSAPSGAMQGPPLTQPAAPQADGEPDEARNDEAYAAGAPSQTADGIRAPAARPAPDDMPANMLAGGLTLGVVNGPSRVGIRARADSWVQVRDPTHAAIYTGVLHPSETYRVPDMPGFTFTTGNAGGVALVVDGTAGPPLGAAGQVLRNVPLEAAAPIPAKRP